MENILKFDMKILFASIMMIIFVSTYDSHTHSFAQEVPSQIIIKFNGKTFVRNFPLNYTQSIITIQDMQNIVNSFAMSVDSIDSLNTKTVAAVEKANDSISNYSKSIDSMSKVIDSLNKIIVVNSNKVDKVATNTIDNAQKIIDKTIPKPILNVGFTLGYDRCKINNDIENDIKLSPTLFIKRLMIGVDAGASVGSDNSVHLSYGGSIGFTLK